MSSHRCTKTELLSGGADLHFLSPQPETSLHCQITHEATALSGVPVYVPVFTGTHCTYPRTIGQAEFI